MTDMDCLPRLVVPFPVEAGLATSCLTFFSCLIFLGGGMTGGTTGGAWVGAAPGAIRLPEGFFQAHIR